MSWHSGDREGGGRWPRLRRGLPPECVRCGGGGGRRRRRKPAATVDEHLPPPRSPATLDGTCISHLRRAQTAPSAASLFVGVVKPSC